MMYTSEEKAKIHENLDKIKVYLQTLQPQIRDRITVDFGEMKTYANYERERQFHITVDKTDIYGRSGGLGMDYTRKSISSSTRASVYDHLDYAVELMNNWKTIKSEILHQIEAQNKAISAINSFEI